MDPQQAQQAAAFEALILNGYMLIYVGLIVSTVLYGVTVLQTLYYFRTFNKDKIWIKFTTFILFLIDTATTGIPAQSLYWYLIQNFGNPAEGLISPLSFRIENAIVALGAFIVQCYFCRQLWMMSKSVLLIATVLFFAIAALALGCIVTGLVAIRGDIEYLSSATILSLSSAYQGAAAACDIIITVFLCILLHNQRSGIRKTEKLVDRLILVTIHRGLLTSLAQTGFLVIHAAFPGRLYWIPFHLVVGKLYVNSYLAMLNIRTMNQDISDQLTVETLRFAGKSSTLPVFHSEDSEINTKYQATACENAVEIKFTSDGRSTPSPTITTFHETEKGSLNTHCGQAI